MPVHRVPKGTVHEDVTRIEREGERLVAAIPEGEHYVIFTEFLRPHFESRSPIPRHAIDHGGAFA